MIAEPSLELFRELVREMGGTITYNTAEAETSKAAPLAEFTWNHTTLHAPQRRSVPHLFANAVFITTLT